MKIYVYLFFWLISLFIMIGMIKEEMRNSFFFFMLIFILNLGAYWDEKRKKKEGK